MAERQTTLKGNPFKLMGPELKTGDKAPDFELTDNGLKPLKLSDTKGVRIFSVVPSLDTPVCDMQTRRFNEEASKLDGVMILTVSCDLPFAQKRWCGAAGVDKVTTASDYKNGNFGEAWGTMIQDLRIESRAVFVVDGGNTDHLRAVRAGNRRASRLRSGLERGQSNSGQVEAINLALPIGTEANTEETEARAEARALKWRYGRGIRAPWTTCDSPGTCVPGPVATRPGPHPSGCGSVSRFVGKRTRLANSVFRCLPCRQLVFCKVL